MTGSRGFEGGGSPCRMSGGRSEANHAQMLRALDAFKNGELDRGRQPAWVFRVVSRGGGCAGVSIGTAPPAARRRIVPARSRLPRSRGSGRPRVPGLQVPSISGLRRRAGNVFPCQSPETPGTPDRRRPWPSRPAATAPALSRRGSGDPRENPPPGRGSFDNACATDPHSRFPAGLRIPSTWAFSIPLRGSGDCRGAIGGCRTRRCRGLLPPARQGAESSSMLDHRRA
ncbi:hypothetical protein FBX98_113135 [Burkholderia sp. SJZ115]|nr:hypothetical protein FB600_113110 [Burkholderia sp. SJZ089]TWC98647.1 hypothetical protein FBX98_113135 [Burkholderia sp. SJZ115]TWD02008.1 hypothetical protein FB601_113135 [Burkholderia sp. SJZ091]